jgi:hypothetical protein
MMPNQYFSISQNESALAAMMITSITRFQAADSTPSYREHKVIANIGIDSTKGL